MSDVFQVDFKFLEIIPNDILHLKLYCTRQRHFCFDTEAQVLNAFYFYIFQSFTFVSHCVSIFLPFFVLLLTLTIQYMFIKHNIFPFSRIQKSEDVINVLSECGPNGIPNKSCGYHRKCYSSFTHKKTLTLVKNKSRKEKPTEIKRLTGRKRDRHGKLTSKPF